MDKSNRSIIICIDDEKFVLNSLSSQIKGHFGDLFEVELAESAEEALEIIHDLAKQKREIAIIISDQMMPGMTGDQFLVNVHKDYPKPIKLLLTGQANLDDVVNVINNANLFSYLKKPWESDNLVLTIERGYQQYNLVKEMDQQIELFQKFVPKGFLEALSIAKLTDISLDKNIKLDVSSMFCDVVDFTKHSETLSVEKMFELLNSYMDYTNKIIEKNAGFIDKFLGDGVDALFVHQADDALHSAIEIILNLDQLNGALKKYELPDIRLGIGINKGPVMLGILGCEGRFDNTVIGDTINTTARVEALTRIYGVPIIVTQSVKDGLKNPSQFHMRRLDTVVLKGKSIPVQVYEVFSADSQPLLKIKQETLEDYEKAMDLYLDNNLDEAMKLFVSCLNKNPFDRVLQMYVGKCQKQGVK